MKESPSDRHGPKGFCTLDPSCDHIRRAMMITTIRGAPSSQAMSAGMAFSFYLRLQTRRPNCKKAMFWSRWDPPVVAAK